MSKLNRITAPMDPKIIEQGVKSETGLTPKTSLVEVAPSTEQNQQESVVTFNSSQQIQTDIKPTDNAISNVRTDDTPVSQEDFNNSIEQPSFKRTLDEKRQGAPFSVGYN